MSCVGADRSVSQLVASAVGMLLVVTVPCVANADVVYKLASSATIDVGEGEEPLTGSFELEFAGWCVNEEPAGCSLSYRVRKITWSGAEREIAQTTIVPIPDPPLLPFPTLALHADPGNRWGRLIIARSYRLLGGGYDEVRLDDTSDSHLYESASFDDFSNAFPYPSAFSVELQVAERILGPSGLFISSELTATLRVDALLVPTDRATQMAQLRCKIAKQRAVTRDASCRLRRAALALRAGSDVDDTACAERLTAAFERAEDRYDVCATSDDASDRAEATRVFVAERIAAVTQAAGIDGNTPNRCASYRSRALASHYRCESAARLKELRGRDGQRVRARCDAALENRWARLLSRYHDSCGEADPVEIFIEANRAAVSSGAVE